MIPDVKVTQLNLPGMGSYKVEYLIRDIQKMNKNMEVTHNLIIHMYHVKDNRFMERMKQAWHNSGLADRGVALERCYTDEINDFVIDAWDAILYDIEPYAAESYLKMFLGALEKIYAADTQRSGSTEDEDQDADEDYDTDGGTA